MQRFRIFSVISILILVIASLPAKITLAATAAAFGPNIEAENYSARSSNAVGVVAGTDGSAVNVLAARPNEWTSYNNLDLTSTAINLRYANAYAAATLEVRAATSTGALLGTCNLPLTGGWTAYVTLTCSLSGAGTASQTLVLVFKDNNYANINWFALGSGSNPTTAATLTSTRTFTPGGPTPTNTVGASATMTRTSTRTNTPVGPTATMTRTSTLGLTATQTRTNTPTTTPTQGTPGQNTEAENYSARSSTAVGAVSGTDGTAATVLAARPNEWTSYTNQNLAITNINLRYSNAYAAATLEVRSGTSTGTLLGTCNLPLTGTWTTFATSSCSLSGAGAAGQTLVLVFKANNYAYINWFNLGAGGSGNPTATATVPQPTFMPPSGKVFVGYWENWQGESGDTWIPLNSVNDKYNVLIVAFPTVLSDGTVTMTGLEGSLNPSVADVALAHSRGKKVLISIGGALGSTSFSMTTQAQQDNFVSSIIGIVDTFHYDGIDIDIERNLDAPGPPNNPGGSVAHIISALNRLKDHYGPNFMLTFAPETANTVGAIGPCGAYGGIWGNYLPIFNALKSRISFVHMQYYNTSGMFGLDCNIYDLGTQDSITAWTEAMIEGFPIGRSGVQYTGLDPSQVVIGLPAWVQLPSTYTSVSTKAAWKCLTTGACGGGYQPRRTYPTLRGLMTWDVNIDKGNNYNWIESLYPCVMTGACN